MPISIINKQETELDAPDNTMIGCELVTHRGLMQSEEHQITIINSKLRNDDANEMIYISEENNHKVVYYNSYTPIGPIDSFFGNIDEKHHNDEFDEMYMIKGITNIKNNIFGFVNHMKGFILLYIQSVHVIVYTYRKNVYWPSQILVQGKGKKIKKFGSCNKFSIKGWYEFGVMFFVQS